MSRAPEPDFTPDPERHDHRAPEYRTVDVFAQHLYDDERATYTTEELHALARRTRVRLQDLHKSLEAYGLRAEERPVPRAVRGYQTSSHDRWYGPGSSKTAGGSGWEVISGFAGDAAKPG